MVKAVRKDPSSSPLSSPPSAFSNSSSFAAAMESGASSQNQQCSEGSQLARVFTWKCDDCQDTQEIVHHCSKAGREKDVQSTPAKIPLQVCLQCKTMNQSHQMVPDNSSSTVKPVRVGSYTQPSPSPYYIPGATLPPSSSFSSSSENVIDPALLEMSANMTNAAGINHQTSPNTSPLAGMESHGRFLRPRSVPQRRNPLRQQQQQPQCNPYKDQFHRPQHPFQYGYSAQAQFGERVHIPAVPPQHQYQHGYPAQAQFGERVHIPAVPQQDGREQRTAAYRAALERMQVTRKEVFVTAAEDLSKAKAKAGNGAPQVVNKAWEGAWAQLQKDLGVAI